MDQALLETVITFAILTALGLAAWWLLRAAGRFLSRSELLRRIGWVLLFAGLIAMSVWLSIGRQGPERLIGIIGLLFFGGGAAMMAFVLGLNRLARPVRMGRIDLRDGVTGLWLLVTGVVLVIVGVVLFDDLFGAFMGLVLGVLGEGPEELRDSSAFLVVFGILFVVGGLQTLVSNARQGAVVDPDREPE